MHGLPHSLTRLQACPWKHARFFFSLERNNCNFPLTEGEDQIIARIVELLKYSGEQLEREVGSVLN